MNGRDYESTPLWRAVFADSALESDPVRERLRSSYRLTRDTIATLLAELGPSVPGFTVHDISHSDALWETGSLLCGEMTTLTPAETYVLGCAFLFHDAAMGTAAYKRDVSGVLGEVRWSDLLCAVFRDLRDHWPAPDELSEPPDDVLNACTVRAIRESHAEQAAVLVDQPWTTSAGNQLYLIQDLELRESYGPLIGRLAESHWRNVDELPELFGHTLGSLPSQPPGWIIEPLKLAFILRLADAMQIDGRRAPTFLRALRQPAGASHEHWRFQEYVGRPHLTGSRVSYSSWREFGRDDIDAWWLALDYLRGIDLELKKVDSLLYDLRMPRLAVQAVAGVDSPKRFVKHFPVNGWRPVDAVVTIADTPRIVANLGGEQLYGLNQEVAVRELIQNSQDAVLARRALDPTFTVGRIVVRLRKSGDTWTLEVEDNGLGMDEDALLSGLLSFGTPGWSLDSIRRNFPGLASSGFQPRGRFGIGFFSVFMLGDSVEVLTRPHDRGREEARRLLFRGVGLRPLLSDREALGACPPGTIVRVALTTNPFDASGIFYQTYDDNLVELVQRLAIERAVPIEVVEEHSGIAELLPVFNLQDAAPEDVFDALYPRLQSDGEVDESLRVGIRKFFSERATEILDESGRRIGLAHVDPGQPGLSARPLLGLCIVNGFLADEHASFIGYIEGRPNRASRDQADLVATSDQLTKWVRDQVALRRNRGEFTTLFQTIESNLIYRSYDVTPEYSGYCLIDRGVITERELRLWVSNFDEIIMALGFPLIMISAPLSILHMRTYEQIRLPDGWVYPANWGVQTPFQTAIKEKHDDRFSAARADHGRTWQKRWWHMSGRVTGRVVQVIAEEWKCGVEQLLRPIEERGWSDFRDLQLSDGTREAVPVFVLRRP